MLHRHPHHGGCFLQRVHRQTALCPAEALPTKLVKGEDARKAAAIDPTASNKKDNSKLSVECPLCRPAVCGKDWRKMFGV
jgi:hypothetical protein